MKTYTITASDQLTKAVIVPDRGGWVSSLILPLCSGAREILFQHDYAWDPVLSDLPGGLPFLFPICGRLALAGARASIQADESFAKANRSGSDSDHEGFYLYDNKQYELKIHGFSWYEKWIVENVTDHSIEIVLRDNENTLSRYPFHFEVRLKYEVLPGKLLCHQTYKNNETVRAMPYYAGFHPYFLIPNLAMDSLCAKASSIVNFNAVHHLKYNAALTNIIGEQPALLMPSSITNPEINEQLSMLSNDKLATLTFPNGDVISVNITQHAEYFPYLQLYTIPEKPFFCIEHWMGFPNALNVGSGVRWLKPKETETAVYEVSA